MSECAIVIPTINRVDYLIPALMMYSVECSDTNIYVFDNGDQKIASKLFWIKKAIGTSLNIRVFRDKGNKNIGVAASWNVLCKLAFKECDYALVLNDDVYLNVTDEDLNLLVDGMRHDSIDFLRCEERYDMSAFIISKKCFEVVGPFDDGFTPAYYEDSDYLYRLSLRSCEIKYHSASILNPQIFRRSSSLLKDGSIIGNSQELNKRLYIQKWGGDVGEEKYLVPFNRI